LAHFIDFHVGGWKVGSIGQSAGIFVGQNLQYGWRSSLKTNQSSSRVAGDGNCLYNEQNTIQDQDMLDTWVQKAPPYAALQPPSPALARTLLARRQEYRQATMKTDIKLNHDEWDW